MLKHLHLPQILLFDFFIQRDFLASINIFSAKEFPKDKQNIVINLIKLFFIDL